MSRLFTMSRHAFALLIIPALMASPTLSDAATYRCADSKGKVSFQDFPCDTAPRNTPAPATSPAARSPVATPSAAPQTPAAHPSATGYSSARGAWRGPAQFHLMADGKRDLQAHRLAPMVIEFASDGKVYGIIGEGDCKLSGLATQFVTPTEASVDVTMKGCKDSRFNTRMTGMLSTHAASFEAKLHLTSVAIFVSQGMQQLSIDAVLKR